MNAILDLFFHPAKERGEPVPSILGLTASPVTNVKHGSLAIIDKNLFALAVTPKQHRVELEMHVNPPTISTIVYSEVADDVLIVDPLCASLASAARSYNFEMDPYVLEMQEQNDDWSLQQLAKVMLKHSTYCYDQVRAMDVRARSIREHLGDPMAAWYIDTCISRFREGLTSCDIVLPELSEKEKAHLNSIFIDIERQAHAYSASFVDSVIHPTSDKIMRLVNVLVEVWCGMLTRESRARVGKSFSLVLPRLETEKLVTVVGCTSKEGAEVRTAHQACTLLEGDNSWRSSMERGAGVAGLDVDEDMINVMDVHGDDDVVAMTE